MDSLVALRGTPKCGGCFSPFPSSFPTLQRVDSNVCACQPVCLFVCPVVCSFVTPRSQKGTSHSLKEMPPDLMLQPGQMGCRRKASVRQLIDGFWSHCKMRGAHRPILPFSPKVFSNASNVYECLSVWCPSAGLSVDGIRKSEWRFSLSLDASIYELGHIGLWTKGMPCLPRPSRRGGTGSVVRCCQTPFAPGQGDDKRR